MGSMISWFQPLRRSSTKLCTTAERAPYKATFSKIYVEKSTSLTRAVCSNLLPKYETFGGVPVFPLMRRSRHLFRLRRLRLDLDIDQRREQSVYFEDYTLVVGVPAAGGKRGAEEVAEHDELQLSELKRSLPSPNLFHPRVRFGTLIWSIILVVYLCTCFIPVIIVYTDFVLFALLPASQYLINILSASYLSTRRTVRDANIIHWTLSHQN